MRSMCGLTYSLFTLCPLSIKLNVMGTQYHGNLSSDGSLIDVPCSSLLPGYQKYISGVDRGDQLIGCYNRGRRSRKWWN